MTHPTSSVSKKGTLMPIKIILSVITIFTSVILMLKIPEEKDTEDIYDFTMRPTRKSIILICSIGILWLVAMSILIEATPFVSAELYFLIVLTVAELMYFVFCLSWKVDVKNDLLTKTRLWLFTRSVKISDIDRCEQAAFGMNIYIKTRKALSIDYNCSNRKTLLKRIETEGNNINS